MIPDHALAVAAAVQQLRAMAVASPGTRHVTVVHQPWQADAVDEALAHAGLRGERIDPTRVKVFRGQPLSHADQVQLFVERNHYVAGLPMPDGRVSFVIPTLFGGDIAIGAEATELAGIAERYSYPSAAEALVAWSFWRDAAGFAGEPEGWIRHIPSNRRRPGGDPTREEIRP